MAIFKKIPVGNVPKKPICTMHIRWAHVAWDPITRKLPPIGGRINIKIVVAPVAFKCDNNAVWFDLYVGVSERDKIIFAVSMRRFNDNFNMTEVINQVFQRVPQNCTDEFIMSYANGCSVDVMKIAEINALMPGIKYSAL